MKTATVYPQTPEQTSLPAYLQAAKQQSSQAHGQGNVHAMRR